ncbi:ArsR/SmtB family transcription factor [Rubinisphaera margarita]|uniref:ArsR/SmtB family transcription factor n=1 Tax=Rubinisphaera margarita TaxID=2909586 RepID=UPI001EE88FA8|nr:metalloregulator ArsR/SmtB family transcription factor [Rubinisphaera margarita]MCG6155876.1 metalloregulator ArsR/SmtB family transcription factor [Rubinisphaera margarita]
MPVETKKQAQIYEQLSGIGGALANPHRLKMLQLLTHGERTIDELGQLTEQSLAATSAHVKSLKASHLVSTEKRGRSTFCYLSDARVLELWLRLRDLGEIIVPEIREIMREDFDADTGLSPLTPNDLNTRLKRGRFILLDLRPGAEFEKGHLPRARNIPFDTLETACEHLPRKTPLLVYCRGPFCAAAMEGNQRLRDQSFNSLRLRFSVPEWRAAGLPVEEN